MSLILPRGPSWSHWTSNLAPTGLTDIGVAVPAGSTTSYAANTDGDPVTLLDDLAHDCEYLIVGINSSGVANGNNTSMLVDILVDYAGGTSWTELISDLFGGFSDVASAGAPTHREYHFPVWLPAGTAIGARARCAHSALVTPKIVVQAGGGNANPGSWWCGQKVVKVGNFTPASSIGQSHTPGASGTFSSWASLGSALGREAGAVQWAIQGEMTTNLTAAQYRWQFGMGSRQIGPEFVVGATSSNDRNARLFNGPIFHSFPAGAQLQVRGTNFGGSAQPAHDVGAYVVE